MWLVTFLFPSYKKFNTDLSKLWNLPRLSKLQGLKKFIKIQDSAALNIESHSKLKLSFKHNEWYTVYEVNR